MKILKNKLAGKFIVLDGPDGAGKGTQLKLLTKSLKAGGVNIVNVIDPGGTDIGDNIRKLVKYGSKDIDVRTEVMLFMASRAQLVAEVIQPALEEGKTILGDRFISSTCAYQGASGYPIEQTLELGKLAVGEIWPNLTIILDLPPKIGRERTGVTRSKKVKNDYGQKHLFDSPTVDQFDSRTLEYHKKVRKMFLQLDGVYPGVVKTIDVSSDNIEEVSEKIKKIIEETDF